MPSSQHKHQTIGMQAERVSAHLARSYRAETDFIASDEPNFEFESLLCRVLKWSTSSVERLHERYKASWDFIVIGRPALGQHCHQRSGFVTVTVTALGTRHLARQLGRPTFEASANGCWLSAA